MLNITKTVKHFLHNNTVSDSKLEGDRTMNSIYLKAIPAAIAGSLMLASMNLGASAFVQCPAGGVPTESLDSVDYNVNTNIKCMHLGAGDGYITMADGKLQYMFGFSDLTGVPQGLSLDKGLRAAEFPAPSIILDEGDEFTLSLTNVGMADRPDLADPHTVHFHGFANASSYFDGVPDVGVSVNLGSSLTYFYNIVDPGTYMYHCHVEASEHMQMGMIGNLYVKPKQNKLPNLTNLNGYVHNNNIVRDATTGVIVSGSQTKYVYNDGDGSTQYDVEFPMQLSSFDSAFHDASMTVQPLPFANMFDNYPMLNGRGYPDTINTAALTAPAENGNKVSQKVNSYVQAVKGQKILLRFSNLSITNYFSVGVNGLSMKVVGRGARLLRGPESVDAAGLVTPGKNLYYNTNSVTLGGGESMDVIIDTTNVVPGTYILYTTNLNYLSNGPEDFGGIMTEIEISL